MMSEEIEAIHKLLSKIEVMMQDRPKGIGVNLAHLLIATGLSRITLVLGVTDAEVLKPTFPG